MTSEIVYPLGTATGDLRQREQERAHREAVVRENARRILNGEELPTVELPPQHSAFLSDFGQHPHLEPGDTRGLDYSEEAERQARIKQQRYASGSRRRARLKGATVVERINRAAIIARDKSICHICKQHVEVRDVHLDHVIPLAHGGDHSADNLRVSHSTCNLSKGARLVA